MKHFLERRNRVWNVHISFLIVIAVVCFLLFESAITVSMSSASTRRKIQEETMDFTDMSLEELKQVMIISILKKPQKLSDATSAISVITQEDIRRSGVTNIPELLRSVPGFQVAQISSNTWAVSARGFNNRFANKLLVLMDGRSVYKPLFSGVHWGAQDTILEDIERIEVIRGPGATLWGANAVNGVINIITKDAEDTQGGLITSGWFNEDRNFNAFRYGGKLNNNDAYWRLYLKYSERDSFLTEDRDDLSNNWNSVRGGGRLDWSLTERDSLSMQGEIYEGRDGERMTRPYEPVPFYPPDKASVERERDDIDNNYFGANLLCHWRHTFSNTSDMTFQLYYDQTKQDIDYIYYYDNICAEDKKITTTNFANQTYKERFDILDFDLQHNFRLSMRHEIVWGLGYRFIKDIFEVRGIGGTATFLNPERRNTQLVSGFVQYGTDLVMDRLKMTLGSKFEDNDYTGFEYQPSVRILWRLTERQNFWAAVSRATRTPSRFETDYFEHSTNIGSEELIAYELGYRIQPADYFSMDLTGFYNEYDNLIAFIKDKYKLDISKKNIAGGQTYGGEMSANWDALKWWRLRGSYAYMEISINIDKDIYASHDIFFERINPRNQFSLLSSMDLFRVLEFDVDIRHVDSLSNYIKGYEEMDARLGWIPRKNMEISLIGQNLLNKSHPEFVYVGFPPISIWETIEVERRVYGKITCRF
ncbi:TonB-dependent receptor [bacterium]|nr:TonB-dependent receptor [bacterium]